MKDSDLARLLVLVGAIDRRIPTQDEIRADLPAWRAMAIEGRWPSFEAARRAIIVHRTRNPDYALRPGHITRILREVERDAASTYRRPPLPPELKHGPLERHDEWYRQQWMRHRLEHFAAWSGSGGDGPLQVAS